MRAVRSALACARHDPQLEAVIVGLWKFAVDAPPAAWRACWRYTPCDPGCPPACRDPRHGERLVYPLPRTARIPAARPAPPVESTPPARVGRQR